MNHSRFDLRECRRCRLCDGRTNIVNGTGSRDAKVVFIGEAPGRDEDLAGTPFVGRAGMILNQALDEAGASRSEVYITNLVRCRPPHNRRPLTDEVIACAYNLGRELEGMSPAVVCAMGQTVVRSLTSATGSMASLVGRRVEVDLKGRKLNGIVTYHPAACLYRRTNLDSFKSAVRKSLEEAGAV